MGSASQLPRLCTTTLVGAVSDRDSSSPSYNGSQQVGWVRRVAGTHPSFNRSMGFCLATNPSYTAKRTETEVNPPCFAPPLITVHLHSPHDRTARPRKTNQFCTECVGPPPTVQNYSIRNPIARHNLRANKNQPTRT